MTDNSEITNIQVVEGIDYVRPPILNFKEIKNNKDFIEYEITTKHKSDKQIGDNPLINYLTSFIYCNDTLNIKVPKKSFMIKDGKKSLLMPLECFQILKLKKQHI